MKEIVFVTHNKGKVKSAEKYFKDLKISTYEFELDEPRSEDVEEIAKSKVLQAYEVVKKPCIAMDAGFFVQELNGFPKAFVNFALDTIGIEGILKLMEGKANRACYFKECLAYYDGKEIKYFFGISPGSLATEIRGNDAEQKWSDLWFIFIPQAFNKTLAEMNEVERYEKRKNDGSSSALEEFAKWYKCEKMNII